MGKRKLGNLHYFSCDYTGFPMAEQSCYCPHWDATDRLQKKGNFCNWESVWGFAIKNTPDPAELTKVREHLIEVCGKLPEEPPAQEELTHIKTLDHTPSVKYDATEYHVKCCSVTDEITVVKLAVNGEISEVTLDSNNGRYDTIKDCMCQATIPRKGKNTPNVAMFWDRNAGTEDTLNMKAEQILKQRIYGDAYLVHVKEEVCFTKRERLTDFSFADYEANFVRKKKQRVVVKGVTSEQYSEQRATMQAELDAAENVFTSKAKNPSSLSAVSRMPPSDGRKLAQIHPQPPPVRRTDSVANYQ
jgi:hypothetical protein